MASPLIPDSVADDPDVSAALKALALETIQHARDILDTAAPTQQLSMIRILLPRLTSSIGSGDEEKDRELRAGLESMYADIRQATHAEEEESTHGDR